MENGISCLPKDNEALTHPELVTTNLKEIILEKFIITQIDSLMINLRLVRNVWNLLLW